MHHSDHIQSQCTLSACDVLDSSITHAMFVALSVACYPITCHHLASNSALSDGKAAPDIQCIVYSPAINEHARGW